MRRSLKSGAARLPILEYHDLTLSRFSRYVWRAAGRGADHCPTSLCPYLQACAESALGTQPAFLQISHSAKQKSREIKMTWGAAVPGHLSTVLIGRADGGLAQFTRGSRNVKMVDGKPTQPRDSVFAASRVDCVCSMLTLPGDRSSPRQWHLKPSLRGCARPGRQMWPKTSRFGHIGLPVPEDCHTQRSFLTDSTLCWDFPKIFPILVKLDDQRLWDNSSCYYLVKGVMKFLIVNFSNCQSSWCRFISLFKIGNSRFHKNYSTSNFLHKIK